MTSSKAIKFRSNGDYQLSERGKRTPGGREGNPHRFGHKKKNADNVRVSPAVELQQLKKKQDIIEYVESVVSLFVDCKKRN